MSARDLVRFGGWVGPQKKPQQEALLGWRPWRADQPSSGGATAPCSSYRAARTATPMATAGGEASRAHPTGPILTWRSLSCRQRASEQVRPRPPVLLPSGSSRGEWRSAHPAAPTRWNRTELLQELARQLDDGRIDHRDLSSLSETLNAVLGAPAIGVPTAESRACADPPLIDRGDDSLSRGVTRPILRHPSSARLTPGVVGADEDPVGREPGARGPGLQENRRRTGDRRCTVTYRPKTAPSHTGVPRPTMACGSGRRPRRTT